MSTLQDLLEKQEELHPDLKNHLVSGTFGQMIQHPLLYEIFYNPQFNARCNYTYSKKKEYAESALKKKEYDKLIWIYERPYRFEKLIQIAEQMSDKTFWELFGSVWIDSENLWQVKKLIKIVFSINRPGIENMMDESEKLFFESLPEEVVVYRGHQSVNKNGYSWTLSYWKAKWFASRFNKSKNSVAKGVVKKQDIIAALTRRGEFEIVLKPENIKQIKFEKIHQPKWLENFIRNQKANSKSVHNNWHWEKVESHTRKLCDLTPDADWAVCQAFAWIHDSQRINDNDDPDHGKRASIYAKKLHSQGKIDLTSSQLNLLCEACDHHTNGQLSDDSTIAVCWDADRLDLSRVSMIPDPKFLSLQASKDLIWRI